LSFLNFSSSHKALSLPPNHQELVIHPRESFSGSPHYVGRYLHHCKPITDPHLKHKGKEDPKMSQIPPNSKKLAVQEK
jgi:hypothetical protein